MKYILHNLFDKVIAFLLLIISLPLLVILYLLIKLDSPGPFIFKQKRMGKDRKVFIIYKVRTMVNQAEKLRSKYLALNEADGPVFKIKDDPRYTKPGKILANLGLDELPQLINILKGNMSMVGPRPLPIDEAGKIPKKYMERFGILPGITSPWVIEGNHNLTFKQWMISDLAYIKNKSIIYNFFILTKTILLIIRIFFNKLPK